MLGAKGVELVGEGDVHVSPPRCLGFETFGAAIGSKASPSSSDLEESRVRQVVPMEPRYFGAGLLENLAGPPFPHLGLRRARFRRCRNARRTARRMSGCHPCRRVSQVVQGFVPRCEAHLSHPRHLLN